MQYKAKIGAADNENQGSRGQVRSDYIEKNGKNTLQKQQLSL